MTFDSNLSTTQQEAMPEFYEMIYGSTTERYTSWESDLTFLGAAYSSTEIKHEGFKQDVGLGVTSVRITAPVSGATQSYVANSPVEPVRIKIYRALKSDLTDYVKIFDGYIAMIAIENQVAQVEIETRSKYLDTYLPRFIYQSYCNNDLFDVHCQLAEGDWDVDGTVAVISGSDIQVAAVNAYADGYFTGGKIRYDTDFRLITKHLGATLTLNVAFDSRVVVGSTVTVYPGCNGAPDTCTNKFDNFEHFNGMFYIPSRNPVIWGFR